MPAPPPPAQGDLPPPPGEAAGSPQPPAAVIGDAPRIILNGASAARLNTVALDAVYEEKGATAIDPEDGDLTESISITGFVDTSAPGDYVVAYDVTDSHGNAAATRTRTVRVRAPEVDDSPAGGVPAGEPRAPPPPVRSPPSPLLNSYAGPEKEDGDSALNLGLIIGSSVLAAAAAVGGIAYALGRRAGGSAHAMMPAQFPSMPERADLAKERVAAARVMRMKEEV